MPAFDFLPLLWWGLPLAAAPLVIHLINLLRYRRVEWAAMEFLLASQRRYRTRVLLRQWLLLALRTAAIAGIVLALAQPRWKAALGGLFGGPASHLVLLDDSYSMGEVSGGPAGQGAGGETPFDRGRRVVERIAADLSAAAGAELAVGLFSQLAGPATDARLAVPRQPVGTRLSEELARLTLSWTAAGPEDPLAFATAAAAEGDASRTVWVVSDFRARDWRTSEPVERLRRLAEAGAAIRLIDCGLEPTAGNLTLERLEPVGGVPAAGVLLPLEVEVRNDGSQPARDLLVELREDGAARPALRFAEVPAGGSVTRRFDVRFAEPGGHLVEARLPADLLAADNVRTAAIDVVERVEVLLVADDAASGRAGDAFYVATALAPGAAAATGLKPRIESPAALARLDLARFDCLWILDVERLDAAAVAALEAYARAGGGVVFFCGPRTRAETVNRQLHRGGEGLFPVPLAGPVEVLPASGPDRVPDIVVEEHPVVAVLSGQRNPLLDAVRVERVMAVERGLDEKTLPGLRRLLSLRSGGPLVVERPFGKGLVAAVLTTAAPEWNSWARGNPSWVVVMLELESHLARNRRRAADLTVGDELVVRLEPGRDEPEVDFLVPPEGSVVRQAAARPAAGLAGSLEARLMTERPGAYAARWRSLDGGERELVAAVNVDAAEGRLERMGRERLERALAGIPFRYDKADALSGDTDMLAGVPLARPLLLALVAILVAEQLAACAASYHAPSGRRGLPTARPRTAP